MTVIQHSEEAGVLQDAVSKFVNGNINMEVDVDKRAYTDMV